MARGCLASDFRQHWFWLWLMTMGPGHLTCMHRLLASLERLTAVQLSTASGLCTVCVYRNRLYMYIWRGVCHEACVPCSL
jgi:hypothetical protein